MGRPSIGKVAMTGAERTRLYRLKHSAAKPVTKPVTTLGTDAAALEQELAQAKARIAELEAERSLMSPPEETVLRIAVGPVIAHRPPHRSGRAQLRHPVLTLSI
jgi:hypothetical protein